MSRRDATHFHQVKKKNWEGYYGDNSIFGSPLWYNMGEKKKKKYSNYC